MKAFVLLVALLAAAGAAVYFLVFDKPSISGETRITSVTGRFAYSGTAFTLVVDVEVEALAAMPPVGPHVEVTARCDDASDQQAGDMSLLGNAPPSSRHSDSIELFTRAPLSDQPVKCSVIARMSDGSAESMSACVDLGTSRPGDC
jgi:hypothetical protein